MKKMLFISLCIAFVLSIIPFDASAAEDDSTKKEEMIELACDVFPEYAEIIRGKPATDALQARSNNIAQVQFTETRSVSENKSMMYAQFSNGAAAVAELTFTKRVVQNSAVNELGGVVLVTCTASLACNDCDGVFTLSNIKYKMLANEYDYIVNVGTASTNKPQYCTYTAYTPNMQETSSSNPAVISYHINFFNGIRDTYVCDFSVYIGNNQLWCDALSYEGGTVITG